MSLRILTKEKYKCQLLCQQQQYVHSSRGNALAPWDRAWTTHDRRSVQPASPRLHVPLVLWTQNMLLLGTQPSLENPNFDQHKRMLKRSAMHVKISFLSYEKLIHSLTSCLTKRLTHFLYPLHEAWNLQLFIPNITFQWHCTQNSQPRPPLLPDQKKLVPASEEWLVERNLIQTVNQNTALKLLLLTCTSSRGKQFVLTRLFNVIYKDIKYNGDLLTLTYITYIWTKDLSLAQIQAEGPWVVRGVCIISSNNPDMAWECSNVLKYIELKLSSKQEPLVSFWKFDLCREFL